MIGMSPLRAASGTTTIGPPSAKRPARVASPAARRRSAGLGSASTGGCGDAAGQVLRGVPTDDALIEQHHGPAIVELDEIRTDRRGAHLAFMPENGTRRAAPDVDPE